MLFSENRLNKHDSKCEVFFKYFFHLRTNLTTEEEALVRSLNERSIDNRGLNSNVPKGFRSHPELYIVVNKEHVFIAMAKYFSTVSKEYDLSLFVQNIIVQGKNAFDWVLNYHTIVLLEEVKFFNLIPGVEPIVIPDDLKDYKMERLWQNEKRCRCTDSLLLFLSVHKESLDFLAHEIEEKLFICFR
jgi:hypothetical protein